MNKKERIFNYINWLERFTKKNPSFTNDDCLYFKEEIDENDLKQISKLQSFYEVIEKYANENYIYPDTTEFGIFFKIKFENTGFKIGLFTGQGTFFFCSRVQPEKGFIDLHDIINDHKQENTTTINQKLNELSCLVTEMYESGIPVEAIKDTLYSALKPKTLIKK